MMYKTSIMSYAVIYCYSKCLGRLALKSQLQQTTNILWHLLKFSKKIRYDISWESSAGRRFSWIIISYWYFWKSGIIWNCRLLQIIGALWVLMHTFWENLSSGPAAMWNSNQSSQWQSSSRRLKNITTTILSTQRTTMTQICLRGCAGWFVHVLYAKACIKEISHDGAKLKSRVSYLNVADSPVTSKIVRHSN